MGILLFYTVVSPAAERQCDSSAGFAPGRSKPAMLRRPSTKPARWRVSRWFHCLNACHFQEKKASSLFTISADSSQLSSNKTLLDAGHDIAATGFCQVNAFVSGFQQGFHAQLRCIASRHPNADAANPLPVTGWHAQRSDLLAHLFSAYQRAVKRGIDANDQKLVTAQATNHIVIAN